MTEDRLSPCEIHGCHRCCVATMMTLSEADAARLEAAGHSAFARLNEHGELQLLNRQGRCVFLRDGGRCAVYEIRPEGCRLYPLILDLDLDRPVVDAFCPHGGEFLFSAGDELRLREAVGTEADERRRRGLGPQNSR